MPLSAAEKAQLIADAAAMSAAVNALVPDGVSAPPAPTITSFIANPATLPIGGGQVTLTWAATDAQSFMIDGAAAVSGAQYTLVGTHTFALVAHGQTAPDATANLIVAVAVAQGTDSWERVNDVFTAPDVRAGPNTNQGWWEVAALNDGRTFISAGGTPTSPDRGTFFFDPGARKWSRTNTDTTSFWKNLTAAENYSLCYDHDRNLIYKSLGSPNGWGARLNNTGIAANATAPHLTITTGSWLTARFRVGDMISMTGWTAPATANNGVLYKIIAAMNLGLTLDKVPIAKAAGDPVDVRGDENSSANYGELVYHIDADEFVNAFPASSVTFRPLTPDEVAHWDIDGLGKNISSGDGQYEYYQNAVYAFGSFSGGSGFLRKRDLLTGAITTLTTNLPPWTLASRTPELRGGLDHRNGKVWTLADNCELYTRDVNAPLNTPWTHVVTTGAKPVTTPPGDGSTGTDWGILSALDETADCIVAWCGQAASAGTINMATIRKTWILPLDTLAWRDGPGLPSGSTPLPPAHPATAQALDYNPGRQKCQLVVSDSGGSQVWELTVRGSL